MEAEIFPAKLDNEEMGMRRKEWELLGYDIEEKTVRQNPIFKKSLVVTWPIPVGLKHVIYMWDGAVWEGLGL